MRSDSKFLLLALALATAVLAWPDVPCGSLLILALLVALGWNAVGQRRG